MSFVNAVKGTQSGRASAKNNSFAQATKKAAYVATTKNTQTENGMAAHSTTSSALLDLFGLIGSARGTDITKQFLAAYGADADKAARMLLWARDIREGAGERQTFRNLLEALEKVNPFLAGKLLHKIPLLGRWDDVFSYRDYTNRRNAFAFIVEALRAGDALCAKWMPRKGPIAVELTRFMEVTPKQYRKTLVRLTNVVESKMCAKDWDEIDFSKLPSVASARYQKAFGRNATANYSAYKQELSKPVETRDPKVKVNAGAVYPYDVLKSVLKGDEVVANAQWDALPNFIGDAKILPVVDVSGSMGSLYYSGRSELQPIDIAVSLGLYCSSKNTGKFKDLFVTFSAEPEFQLLSGNLSTRVQNMSRAKWDMNTNLERVFHKTLDMATRFSIAQKDMPSMILIFSDMQFDKAANGYMAGGVTYNASAVEMIKRQYADAGYKMPKVVFWNLNSTIKNVAVKFDQRGVAHVSGFSPAILKSILSDKLEKFTPENVMLETIMKDRYAI